MSKSIKKYCKRETIAFTILGFAVIAVAGMFLSSAPGSAAGKPNMSTPIISCGGSGQDYIDINVTAGSPTGAPAGFSIQWQTTGDYEQFGWPSSCLPDAEGNPTCGETLCAASFSGNAASSNYSLAAGQSVTVRIGDLVPGNGVSTDCPDARLLCGHNYVFRAFAHANSTAQRSDFTVNLTCSTSDCPIGCDPNVKSLDFWKTHSMFCTGEGCQEDAWPESVLASGMTVGCTTYTAGELEAILLATPGEGDCTAALLQQVIIANLNIANGASQGYIDLTAESLAVADELLCGVGEGDCASLTNDLDSERAEFECPAEE